MSRSSFGILAAYALAMSSTGLLVRAIAGLTPQIAFTALQILIAIPLGYWLGGRDAKRRRESP